MDSIPMAASVATSQFPNPNASRNLLSTLRYHTSRLSPFLISQPRLRPILLRPTPSPRPALAQETTPLGVPPEASTHEKLRLLAKEFSTLPEPIDRVKRLLEYASQLIPLPEEQRTVGNRVMGCTAQVWVTAEMDEDGKMRFKADSDSEITKGFCACLVGVLDKAMPDEVLEIRTEELKDMNVVVNVSGRVNTWYNVLVSMQKRTKALVAERVGRLTVEPFPPLTISNDNSSSWMLR